MLGSMRSVHQGNSSLFLLRLEQLARLLVNSQSSMAAMLWEVRGQIRRYFPKGIEIYFDKVGGPMLDAVLLNMRTHGCIAVCGMVSQHGITAPVGIHNLFFLVSQRIRMQGFIQHDHLHLFPQFVGDITKHYRDGKVVYVEDMSVGLESGPAAFVGLFSGKNVGKYVVCVSQDRNRCILR